jgi:hypothetical protein
MKKVNLLLVILYINNLILIIVNTYFAKIYIELILWLFTKVEPQLTDLDNFDPTDFYGKLNIILFLWFIIYLIISVINIISVVLDYRKENSEILFRKMKRVKIGLIPFWIINFICYFPISIILLVAGHGFGFLIVPIFIFLSYTVLLLTSIFSILYLLNLKKKNIIIQGQFIKHSILQLLFVFDIIDTIIIIKKWGKSNSI